MKVYALVGKSGTGKSFQAMNLCRDKDIESIIDDGLFIYKGNSLGGKSAKREETKIGAIKCAIFREESHREEVANLIKEVSPKNILIIGTSIKMVDKIADVLNLKKIDEYIYIEDITTKEQREIAYKQRNIHGKHVVPVPSFQLKQQFSGYFISPLKIFRGITGGKESFSEKTVVRPTYSYMGKYTIYEKAIIDIIKCVGDTIEGIEVLGTSIAIKTSDILQIEVYLAIDKKKKIMDLAEEFQEKSHKTIETMTAFSIKDLNIDIKSII